MLAIRGSKRSQATYGLAELWSKEAALPRLSGWGMAMHQVMRGVQSFLSAPVTSTLSVLVIAVSLLSLGVVLMLISNASGLVGIARAPFSVSVYLRDEALRPGVDALTAEAKKAPGVTKVVFKNKDQALEEFRSALGEHAGLLEGLRDENPLPASLEVEFNRTEESRPLMEEFRKRWQAKSEVDEVQFNEGLLTQILGILKIFESMGIAAVVFMCVVTALTIASTVRLACYSFREEIQIMRLVGATNRWIKAPFVIEGVLQGLVGGLLSLPLLYGVWVLISNAVLSSSTLRELIPAINFVQLWQAVVIVSIGVVVGAVGSAFAVRKAVPDQRLYE